MEPISIQAPTYQQPEQISIPAEDNSSPLPSTAQNRATRASLGISPLTGLSQSDISQQIMNGQEGQLRVQSAAQIDSMNERSRIDAIKRIAAGGQDVPDNLRSSPSPTDPRTVFEKSFANAFTSDLFKQDDPDGVMAEAYKLLPQHVNELHSFTKESIAKHQYAVSKMEDAGDAVSKQSWLGWGVDQGLQMFQPYNELRMRGDTEGASGFAVRLLGSDLKEQADSINSEPTLEGFRTKLDTALDKLKGNPSLQQRFLSYVLNSEDPTWDNFWTAAMAAGGVGTAARWTRLFGRVTRAARDASDVAKSVGIPKDLTEEEARWEGEGGAVLPDVARDVASGHTDEAAIHQTVHDQEAKITGKYNPTVQAAKDLPAAFKRINLGDAGLHARDLVIRIRERLNTLGDQFTGMLKNQLRVNTIPDITQNEVGARAALDLIRKENPELGASLFDIEGFFREPVTNAWYYRMKIGNLSGERFDSARQAQAFATHAKIELFTEGLEPLKTTTIKTPLGKEITTRWMPPGGVRGKQLFPGASIEEENGKFFISKFMPFDQNNPELYQYYGQTKEVQAPWSPVRAFVDWFTTPENSMSASQRKARMISTEGPSAFYRLMNNATSTLPKLKRGEAQEIQRIISVGMETPNEELGKMGKFFTIGELDDQFIRAFGHAPSDQQVEAYYEFRGAMEADYWLRDVSYNRNALQDGNSEWQFRTRKEHEKTIESPWVVGKRVQEFPGNPDAVIALLGKGGDPAILKSGNTIRAKELERYKEDIGTGKAKLIRIWNTDLRELSGHFGIEDNDRVQYVLSYDSRDRGMSYGKLGRSEGGHLVREYEAYLSQANTVFNRITKKWVYLRDNNLLGFMSHAEAKRAGPVFDKMRQFKLDKDEAGARAYWNDNVVGGLSFKDIWGAFDESRGPGGVKIPPRLNLHEPIQFRPKDKTLMDLGKSALEDRYSNKGGLVDGTKSGNPARAAMPQFTGERDAMDFMGARDVGTKYNPIFKVAQDPYVDGIAMMNRGLGRIINSLFMDDYKMSAVKHWLFGAHVPSASDPNRLVGAIEYLNNVSRNEAAHSPYFFFHNHSFKPGTPANVKAALEADAAKIKAFIGVPSKIDTFLYSLEQTMTDSIYGKFGPKALKLTPLWKISKLSDGPRFLRSILYNTKMGFFSPRQFLIHFFTFINAALISPQYAGHGLVASIFHGWSALNKHPNILAMLDEKASKFGWRPGEWKEGHDALLRTNFQTVESSSLALVDDPTKTNIIQNKVHQYLDIGMKPFKGGVKSLKTAAWYTAFKEYRDLHPTGALRDDDIERILLRANDLSHNMSRASTSGLQKGIMTFGAQFSSYNLRLAELLVGKRLTGAEKARLFFGYMGIFGVPTAGGIFGLSSVLRNQVDKGNVPGLTEYVPGYDFTSTAIMEGLVPAIANELTGHVPNLGESYGAKDLEVIERSLDGDTSLWQFFGGAAYSSLSNTWANSSPFRLAMMNMLKGEGPYTITANDWVHMLSEISSVNYAWRTYMALETGKYMSRNGAYLAPASPEWAIFTGITGLADQSVADIYRTQQGITERRQMEAQTFREYAKVMTQYFNAMADNNISQAEALGKNAAILLQAIPIQERGRAIARIANDNKPLIDRIEWSRATDRSVPDADRQRQQNIYNKIQDMKNRNQQ